MMDYAARLNQTRSTLDVLRGRRQSALDRVTKSKTEITRLEGEEEVADLSANVIRTLIDDEVTLSVRAVESLLTDGLRAVFEDQDLRVRADVDVQRGKVSVDLVTVQRQADGTETEALSRDAYGGAVTTVQSVLLRVIVMMRRGLRPVLFLDESLPAFDANYVTNMGSFLRSLCARLDMDILLVSHNPAKVEAADRSYRIVKADSKATFRRLR